MSIEAKLNILARRIQEERLAYMIEFSKGYVPADEVMGVHGKGSIITTIKPGRKYTKIDVGSSGKYMVVNDTGEIFGVKAYGVINRGRRYGTLDTINDFYWGDYTARRRTS